MFRYNMIPLTNKPTRVIRQSANAIAYIISNSMTGHNNFKSAITKTDSPDYFPIVFANKTNERSPSLLPNLPTCSYWEKILTNLKILCTTKIGMTFRKLNTPTKHINDCNWTRTHNH